MENKARKMFAAVVVIMLCAVAIVGVGYAYNAATQNAGNTVTTEYAVLTPNGYEAKFSKAIVWDTLKTSDTASGTTYTLNTTDNVITRANVDGETGDEYLVQIGTITFTLTNTNMQGDDTYVLEMKSSVALTGNYYAGVKYNNAGDLHYFHLSNEAGATSTISSEQAKSVTTQVVNIYAVFASNTTTTQPDNAYTSATFTFTANVTQAA